MLFSLIVTATSSHKSPLEGPPHLSLNVVSLTENIILGKPSRALDTLYDVIKSKKRNHNVSEKLIEEIMNRYLELCVDLKKSHVAKEGLFQYRNMCQSSNVASLAQVVQGYLSLAEKRTESARQESADSVEVRQHCHQQMFKLRVYIEETTFAFSFLKSLLDEESKKDIRR